MKKENGFMRLLKTHNKVVSLAGAFIVFMTFIAKETKQDQLKELVGAIDSAETVYILRLENRRTFDSLQNFESEFRGFAANPSEPFRSDSSLKSRVIDLPEFMPYVLDSTRVTEELLDNIERLSDKLPASEERGKELGKIHADQRKFWSQVSDAQHIAEKISIAHISGDPSYEDEMREFYSLKPSPSEMYEQFARSVEGMSRKIFVDAESERRKSELSYARWKRIGYGLYFLGWMIGVVGLLVGSREASAE